jgi:aminoglycoside 3-N-acetyltransferase I
MKLVDDLTIRMLKPGDEQILNDLLHLYISVFGEPELPANTDYLAQMLQKDSVSFSVAFMSGKLVGGASSYQLPSIYGNFSELYIYDVAVLPEFQRHGIGSHLLEFLKDYCKSAGIPEMYVQADAPDTEARQFYRKNGGKELDVFQYNFVIT